MHNKEKPVEFVTDRVSSPIGQIIVVCDNAALVAVDFDEYEQRNNGRLTRYYGAHSLREVRNPLGMSEAIRRYLNGDISAIDNLPVRFNGTPFQMLCWQQLRKIPTGTTESYIGLAKSIGRPKASRAVGLANGSNPIAIVVPCHRVIGADGNLTGYGGGMHRKQWLLQHEGALLI
jgi:methylated-DNA-[protein]-cysteine S-methyltransferase